MIKMTEKLCNTYIKNIYLLDLSAQLWISFFVFLCHSDSVIPKK